MVGDNDRYEILEFLNVIAVTLKCKIIVVWLDYIILLYIIKLLQLQGVSKIVVHFWKRCHS